MCMHYSVHCRLFEGKSILVEVHPYMTSFWQSALSVTFLGCFLRGGNKWAGVNVRGVWCWKGTCLRMVCSIGF